MKRRTFVLSGLAAAAAAFAAWEFARAGNESAIEMVVRKRLDYLTLDPDGVRRFAHDIAALHVISRLRTGLLLGIGPIYTRFSLSSGNNAAAHTLRHGEDRIVSCYLISSDFFINGADESRVVKYLGMLDPLHACGNPFARSPG
jgi:hypothetical protein